VKRFKSHHWFGYFFDKSMVLFDNIIQILITLDSQVQCIGSTHPVFNAGGNIAPDPGKTPAR
jgi:hypothetical protein